MTIFNRGKISMLKFCQSCSVFGFYP